MQPRDMRIRWTSLLSVLAVSIGLATMSGRDPAAAQGQPGTSFLVRHVRVFDGERVHEEAQVAVDGGIIRAVGRDLPMWRHLPVIDGTGATLMPGLIDAHVHVRDAGELRQALRFGVTTAFDLGATIEPDALFALRTAANAAADMADLRVAGYVANARGEQEPPNPLLSPSTPRVSTVEGARQFVAMRRAEGADHLKIGMRGRQSAAIGVPNFDEPRVRALVETAHAARMVAVAHVETLEDVRIALAGGVDGLVHVWRAEGANPEIARRIVERGVFVMPTMVGPDSFLPVGRTALLSEPRFQSVLSDSIREHLSLRRSFPAIPAAAASIEVRQRNLDAQMAAARSLREAGATFLVGSDASRLSPVDFGISLHRELELLKDIGLSPSEVLIAATSRTADAFRLRDRGRIAPGLRADLLLVRGDPTSDILATRDILRVWKSGAAVDRRIVER
jgi:imidazolonepropionase-like amidohydrolase